ncbi:MAG: hypothetical protein ABJA10_03530, partial [Aestuariivirga sp.]
MRQDQKKSRYGCGRPIGCDPDTLKGDVKQKLIESHWLMEVVQMLLRRSQKSVQTEDDYYSGKAHPVVFQGSELDVLRMV